MEVTQQEFDAAQSVIDGGGMAYIGGRTAVTQDDLDFIKVAVENEKKVDTDFLPVAARPAPVLETELLSQEMTDAELMAVAAGDSSATPKTKSATKSQAKTGDADGNSDGTTGPVGDEKPAEASAEKPAEVSAPVGPPV